MKKLVLLLVFILSSTLLYSQFDVEAYKEFLEKNKDMSVEQLLQMYPAGNFLSDALTIFMKSEYADSISQKFSLTDYEKSLINKHGFMVTERLNYYTFMQAFWDVYNKDLPVYISSDAILHALHYTFDRILIDLEYRILIPHLDSALTKMRYSLENNPKENSSELYLKAINDLDIYISVANSFIKGYYYAESVFQENKSKVSELFDLIKARKIASYSLFSETERLIDFSQFTPRGHYVGRLALENYFIAMQWLGRSEILFTNPENEESIKHSDEDLHRMAVLAALCAEISENSGADSDFKIIDEILTFLLGRQDNINLWEVRNALKELSFTAKDIVDSDKWILFKEKILELNSANQLYNSQILFSDPNNPNEIKTPAAFLLLGQRPILDGFITANVVFDKILFESRKVIRMIPSTQDILFAFGNDASIQLLQNELKKYPYSSNLAGLRYLIDGYDNDFWKSSVYTCWLNSIRSLNPPQNRGNLPKFMQTAAWWQKTMNTQLANWAEMRHDFMLYAKQSYGGGNGCSYPYGYIEPVPDLYKKIQQLFISLNELTNSEYLKEEKNLEFSKNYYNKWINVCDTLISMSNKILIGKDFSKEEYLFLNSTIRIGTVGCDDAVVGWYPELYWDFSPSPEYMTDFENRGSNSDDFIVADVHTIPTDEDGNMVGWVLHAGTGRINMAVINAPTPDGGSRAYIGPVSSYYEFISNDFKRLTNQEWREMDGKPAFRPEFTNLYLAAQDGNSPNGEKVTLFTVSSSVEKEKPSENLRNLDCFPNPFSGNTSIQFTLTNNDLDNIIELSIFDLKGNLVKTLMNEYPQGKNYSIVWDGTDAKNIKQPSGTYIYTLKSGIILQSGKVSIIR